MAKKKDKIGSSEIKNETIVEIIYKSEKYIETLAKETNYSIDEINILLGEYHNSLDLRMEQFKEEISKTKNDLLAGIEGLKLLKKQIPKMDYSKLEPMKNYCEVFNGEKWVGSPRKLGLKSIIIQK